MFITSVDVHRFALPVQVPKSFEVLAAALTSGNKQVMLANIHRSFYLPRLTLQLLLDYLNSFLSKIIILGGFNIPVNAVSHCFLAFSDMLQGFDMKPLKETTL